MGLSLPFSKASSLPKPHSVPLCFGLPPHNLLPYGTTQPTTSASMVPQRSQQFNFKNECTQFAPLSPKRNQSFPSVSQLIVSFSFLQ
ncbi:hypothetical protein AVEN_66407-1 [Araneus ventricosus]|uniref:Uncharacterized protein n=1 Tax=Araneus ventricosus TaxID=182803 RepID=A0A4Y2EGC3_ARAVE|nr:hypothetical protein AVEN_66407-1 [Araneus ventricosus]